MMKPYKMNNVLIVVRFTAICTADMIKITDVRFHKYKTPVQLRAYQK
jgi:hypothetical protein